LNLINKILSLKILKKNVIELNEIEEFNKEIINVKNYKIWLLFMVRVR